MSLWDALRMNMMISYQELVRTFPNKLVLNSAHNYVSEMGGHQQFKQAEITTKR